MQALAGPDAPRSLAGVDHQHDVHAAGFLLRREEAASRRWLLLRNRKRGEWGFPKGHAEPGEDDLACALRECAEETGIALVAVDGPTRHLRYPLRNGLVKVVAYLPARTATTTLRLSHEHDLAGWFDARGVLTRLPHPSLQALFRAHLGDFRKRT